MKKLDLRKKYDQKDLLRIINELIEENKELKRELGRKIDWESYRIFDPGCCDQEGELIWM